MNVLLGVNGSETASYALEVTVDRVLATGDDLSVALYAAAAATDLDEVEGEVRDYLDASDVEADIRRLDGDPAASLSDLAEREYEHLVMPGGSRSPTGKIQLDKVHQFVLLNAQLPVTLVR